MFFSTACALVLCALSAFAESATISVKGMICDSCAEAVTAKLKSDPAVESVAVNVKKGLVEVTLKQGSKVEDATLKALIADAGYTATEVKRQENNKS